MRQKWIVGVVVVVIIALGGWYFRSSIGSLFGGSPQAPVSQEPADPTADWLTYASSTMGISIKYPPGYALSDTYAYTQVSAKKPIRGVSIAVPAAIATGTNLGSDTYLSVEQLPHAKNCTGDIFVPDNVTAHDVLDNGITYSVATTTGAGAGNRYEENVWAVKDSKPCTAVRYYIHYAAIENYPSGTVQPYDAAALASAFDQIRRTLALTGTVTSNVPSVQ